MPIVEAMACGTPVVASSHPSLDEACGDAAVRVDPDDAEAIAAAIRARARVAGRARGARARARSGASRGARVGETFLARVRGGARAPLRVALDTSPLVQTRAGTARHVRGLLGALAGRDGLELRERSFARRGPCGDRRARHVVVPRRPAACGARRDVLHCPTFRGPLRSRVPLVVTVHDLAVLRHPESFPAWTGCTARALPAPSRGAATRWSPSRSSRSARPSSCSACRRSGSASCRTASSRCFTPDGPAPRATTCSPSARSSRARTSPAPSRRRGSRASSCASSGAAGWGGVEAPVRRRLSSTGRGARARSTAARAASSTRRSTRASASRSLEALACGTPVVTSRGGAMEEMADGAAVLVDPLDVGVDRGRHRRGGAPPRGAARRAARARAGVHVGARRRRDARRLVADGGSLA